MEERKIELEYKRAGNGKRLAAALFDTFVSLVVGAIFLMLTFYLLSISPTLTTIYQEREAIQVRSGLYHKDEENNKIETLSIYLDGNNDLSLSEKNIKANEAMTAFFNDESFFKDGEGVQIYVDMKKSNTTLFDNNGNPNYSFSNPSYETAYWSFYKDELESSTAYLYKADNFGSYNTQIIVINTFAIVGTLLFPFIIFYYVIPMCFRRSRQTLGMLLTHIAIIDGNGLAVKPFKFTMRFLFFYVFEVWASLFCFLIPSAISLGFLILTKSHQTLHDYIFNTYCVDVEEKNIYKDIFEYQMSKDSYLKNQILTKDNDNAEKHEPIL